MRCILMKRKLFEFADNADKATESDVLVDARVDSYIGETMTEVHDISEYRYDAFNDSNGDKNNIDASTDSSLQLFPHCDQIAVDEYFEPSSTRHILTSQEFDNDNVEGLEELISQWHTPGTDPNADYAVDSNLNERLPEQSSSNKLNEEPIDGNDSGYESGGALTDYSTSGYETAGDYSYRENDSSVESATWTRPAEYETGTIPSEDKMAAANASSVSDFSDSANLLSSSKMHRLRISDQSRRLDILR
ncbi:unnamed protein product [Sphagnum compactum]